MRTLIKWIGRLLLLLGIAAIFVGVWKREEINRLLAVNSLFEQDKIVQNFSNMDAAFLNVDVPRGDGPVSPLLTGEPFDLPPSVADWIVERDVTSLLIMKDGQIRHEAYFLDTAAEDRRISWSVAKSYLSALVGILLEEGTIASIDDPVTKYAPELVDSAYDGATLRNVLNMASGVTFNEDYLDFNSDINRMGRVLALGGRMDDFAASLTETFINPGLQWQYVSIDTHVISMVIRGATGRSIADLLSGKVIQPLGLEQSPYYLTDGVGTAFVLGGLNLTTRDYARFGQMFAQGGNWQGEQIVPADWVEQSTKPTAPGYADYGFQWWMPENAASGEYFARGVYGQYIYINAPEQVVIVTTGADRQFREAGVSEQNEAIFRLIVENL
ncbi:MAG: serine hydrolase [Pseudomonadota bacterium]